MKKLIGILFAVIVIATMCKAYSFEVSSYNQLVQSWEPYKSYFIQEDGRVIDYYAESITTSEGQSYALLRAVWMNDRGTFDRVLNWADNNLKVRGDNLYGWKWGKNAAGNWKIIDRALASDADQDIALALIMAYEKWGDEKYLNQAKAILPELWSQSVFEVNNKKYFAAGDWADLESSIKVNPSYFAPYAYRIFSKYDPERDWKSLIDTSYEVLEEVSKLSVVGLPSDWAYIDKTTGKVFLNQDFNAKENDFSYDAIRTLWRVALDCLYTCETRSEEYLKTSTKFLIQHWKVHNTLPASVSPAGVVKKQADSYAVYGAALPAIALVNPEIAKEIYHKKLAAEYVNGYWANPRDYYAQNLIWFGIATWYNIHNKNTKPLREKGLVNLIND